MSAYIQHLALVDEIQPVYIKNTIAAPGGRTLANASDRLNPEIADRIQNLVDSFPEQDVLLESGFTAEVVFELMLNFIESEPNFHEVALASGIQGVLEECISAFASSPAMLQRMNVLAIQLPDVFDQALFCGWMVAQALHDEGVNQKDIEHSFIAALSHDFGLLDIEPSILFKNSPLTPEEWLQLQQHPVLGAQFLERIGGIHKDVVRGVLEHHEMRNGTGYPFRKYQNQLGQIGRLLNILDSANAIFRKHFKNRERSLHDMIAILRVNTLAQRDIFTEMIIKQFRKTAITEHTTLSEELLDDAADTLASNASEIEAFVKLTMQFKRDVGIHHRDIRVLALQDIAKQVKTILTTCGIINEAYMRWIDQVKKERLQFAYRELEDVLLMSNEIKFHILRFNRELELYLDEPSDTTLFERVKQLQQELQAVEKGVASSEIVQYLDGA